MLHPKTSSALGTFSRPAPTSDQGIGLGQFGPRPQPRARRLSGGGGEPPPHRGRAGARRAGWGAGCLEVEDGSDWKFREMLFKLRNLRRNPTVFPGKSAQSPFVALFQPERLGEFRRLRLRSAWAIWRAPSAPPPMRRWVRAHARVAKLSMTPRFDGARSNLDRFAVVCGLFARSAY